MGAILRGMGEGGQQRGRGLRSDDRQIQGRNPEDEGGVRNGGNMSTLLGTIELCWGDVGLLLTLPGQGLGNAAIDAVATPEQIAALRWQVGLHGDHRAGGGQRLGRHPCHGAARWRRVGTQRRENLRHRW